MVADATCEATVCESSGSCDGGGNEGGSRTGVGADASGVGGGTAELLALYESLCVDATPQVRSAAAAAMAELADSLGRAERVATYLAPLYAHTLTDDLESARVAALSASAAIAAAIPLSPAHAAYAPLVACAHDKQTNVRIALAQALAGVARTDAAGATLARELVFSLIGDADLDVRIAIALQAGALTHGLGGPFVASTVLPTLDALLRDENVHARVELATVLMSLARPLGASDAAARLLPLIRLLVEDANTNVRPLCTRPSHCSPMCWPLPRPAQARSRLWRAHRLSALTTPRWHRMALGGRCA